jgi:hypothetical protein
MAAAQDLDSPLIFQCTNCNSIVGDSFSWICATRKLGTITLSGVMLFWREMSACEGHNILLPVAASSNVVLDDEVQISNNKLDRGS